LRKAVIGSIRMPAPAPNSTGCNQKQDQTTAKSPPGRASRPNRNLDQLSGGQRGRHPASKPPTTVELLAQTSIDT
jgi:hypothetical protein